MTDSGMTIKISSERATQIRELAREHGYAPEELIQLSFGLIPMLLQERKLGNKFCVAQEDGRILKEWVLVAPRSEIEATAKKIIASASLPFGEDGNS
jgi:hypothetical protein